jgi:Arc/MetJ family transcription regulator
MRTTISLPDELFAEAKRLAGGASFSDFAAEAIRVRVLEISREQLARAMDEGYQQEAQALSLDLEWAVVEDRHLWF